MRALHIKIETNSEDAVSTSPILILAVDISSLVFSRSSLFSVVRTDSDKFKNKNNILSFFLKKKKKKKIADSII